MVQELLSKIFHLAIGFTPNSTIEFKTLNMFLQKILSIGTRAVQNHFRRQYWA